MDTTRIIKKFLFVTVWVVVGGGMLMLLIAAIGKKNREVCSDYVISIKGPQHHLFVNEEDVEKIIRRNCGGEITGKPVSSFDLMRLESILEENTWIQDAELYFDNRDKLHISLKEREPIARVFKQNGQSFYLDSSARQMPLSDKLSAKLPVFTGFPDNKILRKKDSLLMRDISKTAQFIFNDPFWMAQVAQVNITPSRQFELSPSVGNHKIIIGTAENVEAKFGRLYIFYKQVLAKSGLDSYKLIDVRFNGQVVATQNPQQSRIDSAQLRRNVEKLLSDRDLMKTDSVSLAEKNDPYIKTTNNN